MRRGGGADRPGDVIALRVRGTPEKRERKRRLNVHRQGRLGDAMITEATDETLYYSYSVRGVQYTASQDITSVTRTAAGRAANG